MTAVKVALLLISGCQLFAHVGWMPLTDRELSKAFRVKFLADLFCPPSSSPLYSKRFGQITVQLGGPHGRFRFHGRDRKGKPWDVYSNPGMAGSLYQGDLDRDGQQDLIYAGWTGGNGMAPKSFLVILLQDPSGRGVALEMEGCFGFDEKGIRDLLDLDKDGHAELIRQDYDDGYWVTSLYEFRANRAHLIQGKHAGREFPLYTRFTNAVNRTAVRPKRNRHPREIDLSNQIGVSEFLRLSSAKFDQSDYQWKLLTPDGRTFCMNMDRGTAFVTIDANSFRKTSTIRNEEQVHALLNQIVRRNLPVLLTGRRFERGVKGDGCIESIWAFDSN